MEKHELLAQWGNPQNVGPHGYVRLVDVMGDDAAIVQAARVSYGKGTKTVNEDRGLIRYLIRHRHTTPLEMCEIKLHLRMPIHVARQWIRHRTASVNEYSTRYSEVPDLYEEFDALTLRTQSTTNKQGSAGLLYNENPEAAELLAARGHQAQEAAFGVYEQMLESGVAREQARNVLPLSTYTTFYWKIDLHNLMHFLSLRMDSHAQQEIREFANAIANIVKDWVPFAWEAFEDYRLNAVTLSRMELQAIKDLIDHDHGKALLTGDPPSFAADEVIVGPPQMTLDLEASAKLEEAWRLEFKKPILQWTVERRERFLAQHGLSNKREITEFLGKIT